VRNRGERADLGSAISSLMSAAGRAQSRPGSSAMVGHARSSAGGAKDSRRQPAITLAIKPMEAGISITCRFVGRSGTSDDRNLSKSAARRMAHQDWATDNSSCTLSDDLERCQQLYHPLGSVGDLPAVCRWSIPIPAGLLRGARHHHIRRGVAGVETCSPDASALRPAFQPCRAWHRQIHIGRTRSAITDN
jgi:hypothetical protein